MKHIAILCGGESYEHEVSIITGIQVAETIDQTLYTFSFIYFDKHNQPFLLKNFKRRQDFSRVKRLPIHFESLENGVYIKTNGFFGGKTKIDICYLGFHGGTGESGQIQGMLEVLGVPYTSASAEGSTIAMNKSLTKQVLRDNQLPVLPDVTVFSNQFHVRKAEMLKLIEEKISFPCIIKPVHLGSSIGIKIAESALDLEKHLLVATRIDEEVIVEPALQNFTEYNVSVRSHGETLQHSPIEEPKRTSAYLSFEDKYSNGSKKSGGKSGSKSAKSTGGGMELLDRTVPAKISTALVEEINTLATAVYQATRLSGLVRIDFMYHEEKLYCTEINPIPGSMSFYLWEPTGEQFQDQITQALEDAQLRFKNRIEIIPYDTDIVKKFTN